MPTSKPNDRLAQCMRHPVTVEASASAAEAARLMKSRSAGCLLATDRGRIVGIVTERDIVRKIIASSADPVAVELRQIMTDRVVCCRPDTSPRQAQRLMAECNVPFLPVIADGKARGIVTSADVLKLQLASARTRISRSLRKALADGQTNGRILSGIDKIRSPLSSAISAAESAMASAVSQEQKCCLADLQNAAKSLLGMVEGLLDLSNIAKDKAKLRQENFDFRQAITPTVQQMGAKARRRALPLAAMSCRTCQSESSAMPTGSVSFLATSSTTPSSSPTAGVLLSISRPINGQPMRSSFTSPWQTPAVGFRSRNSGRSSVPGDPKLSAKT